MSHFVMFYLPMAQQNTSLKVVFSENYNKSCKSTNLTLTINYYFFLDHLIPAMQSKDLKFTSKIIGKHFSHFDGYVYIPNVEKEKQYPEDGLVRDKFRNVFY